MKFIDLMRKSIDKLFENADIWKNRVSTIYIPAYQHIALILRFSFLRSIRLGIPIIRKTKIKAKKQGLQNLISIGCGGGIRTSQAQGLWVKRFVYYCVVFSPKQCVPMRFQRIFFLIWYHYLQLNTICVIRCL